MRILVDVLIGLVLGAALGFIVGANSVPAPAVKIQSSVIQSP